MARANRLSTPPLPHTIKIEIIELAKYIKTYIIYMHGYEKRIH